MAAVNRARRVVASEAPAIVRLLSARRQLAPLNICCRGPYIQHDPVNVRRDGSISVINDKRQRLRSLRRSGPVNRRAIAASVAGVLAGDVSLAEYRAGDGHLLWCILPQRLRPADEAAARQQRHRGQ